MRDTEAKKKFFKLLSGVAPNGICESTFKKLAGFVDTLNTKELLWFVFGIRHVYIHREEIFPAADNFEAWFRKYLWGSLHGQYSKNLAKFTDVEFLTLICEFERMGYLVLKKSSCKDAANKKVATLQNRYKLPSSGEVSEVLQKIKETENRLIQIETVLEDLPKEYPYQNVTSFDSQVIRLTNFLGLEAFQLLTDSRLVPVRCTAAIVINCFDRTSGQYIQVQVGASKALNSEAFASKVQFRTPLQSLIPN